ncbi:endospore germination permease [Paenibacillus thailandensis]|uniref:Endospore germination permease n=1 Tax=Paenibacillus thailandensis TaxID=393250 RepID=A0ABW5QT28_9BACL
MNATNKFGITSVVMIILLSVGLSNHVLILPLLLDACRRDAWLSVIAAGLLASLFLLLPFFKVVRDLRGVRLDVWLKRRLSSFWASLIVWFFVLVQFVIAIITLAETAEWTASTYLPETPVIVVSVCLIVLCGFAAWSGLQSIAYVSCILLPIVVLLGDFVMSANLPQKDYRFLLPMLENGYWPVWNGMLYVFSSFAEMFLLLLIQQHFSTPVRRWHLVLVILVLTWLTIGPTIGAITQFGPEEAEKLRYPAFSQWRLVHIGKYLEHVDFFAIFQWLSGALIRISIPLYLIAEYGAFRTRRKKRSVYRSFARCCWLPPLSDIATCLALLRSSAITSNTYGFL